MRLVNRVLPPQPVAVERAPGDVKLFAPEGSAEGCASGECLPEAPAVAAAPPAPVTQPAVVAPPPELAPPDDDEPPPPITQSAPARMPQGDDEKWRRAVDALREASPRHGKSLSNARFLGFTPEGARIAFPQDAAFHRAQITGMSRAMVEAELAKSLGRPIRLVEDTSAAALQSAPRSIAEVEQSDRNTRERSIEQKVRMHPALKNVIRHLGGAIEHIAYLEPVSRPNANAAPVADEGDAGPAVD